MLKSTVRLVSLAIFSCFISFNGIAETEPTGINPIYEVVRSSGHVLRMDSTELNSSILTIHRYQAGILTLPELDALSDKQILREIDFYAKPYSEMTDQSMMITWKRYEMETAMLANEANVDLAKFAPFYRSFNRTMHLGKRLLDNQLSLRNANSSSSYSTFSYSFNDNEVECNASCQALRDEDVESNRALFDILNDMLTWENANGSQPYGSTVRIVDSVSGNSVEVEKYLGSFTWGPVGEVNNCGAAACI
ncbi:hypothetical protein A28LD_0569 [Idiomarina sp. A28L]|uniref:hypothetical protein n=1 Tax=Idiomarina sp. A28L TaxID=1036674 RepID=UPI0002138D9B|nr:hypothetical protein [Idiomarina sp. A28L]EGN76081.1 hypothetical protein A28LD_0569 [Idiomarina sp. A28L]